MVTIANLFLVKGGGGGMSLLTSVLIDIGVIVLIASIVTVLILLANRR